MKKIILTIIITLCIQSIYAQGFMDEIRANPTISAGNYLAYPDKDHIKLTPSPVGYIPFHMEHYGRHGSRWLINEKQYTRPIEALEKAEKYNVLTQKGINTLKKLKAVHTAAANRFGELTDLGAEQHRNIAKRMFYNFPEIFADSAHVDARSTIVIRCILSMENECQQLKEMNPQIRIFHDASNADMYYMNYYDDSIHAIHDKARAIYKEITATPLPYERFISQLINDADFAKDSIDAVTTMENLFEIAGNMQSHNFGFDFYDLFTCEELYALWERWNLFWYLGYGNSKQLDGKLPFIQRNLLHNIIESADNAIKSKDNGASLRFGHEICVLPLACLMELGDCNRRVEDLNRLADEWHSHKIFPMASNIQMIFYRNQTNDDILVKVLLNEEETTLPIHTPHAPYYRWEDLRNYYIDKLQNKFNGFH